jgi:hypothetical protein
MGRAIDVNSVLKRMTALGRYQLSGHATVLGAVRPAFPENLATHNAPGVAMPAPQPRFAKHFGGSRRLTFLLLVHLRILSQNSPSTQP